MDEFRQLKTFLDNHLDELKSKLKILRQEEIVYSSEAELINIDATNVLSGGRRKEIILRYPSVDKYFKKIDLLSNFIYNIKNDKFDEINPYEFRVIINELGYNDTSKIIDDYRELKRNSNKDDVYTKSRENLIEELLEVFKLLANDIKLYLVTEFEKTYGIKNFNIEIDSIINQIDTIKKYNIFDDDGNIIKYFDTNEEIEAFFDWIKSNVDDNLHDIVIPLLMKEELLKENIELFREQEILKNRDKLIEELQEEYLDINNLDLSNYSDTEEVIINKGLEIYKELREKIKDRNDLFKDQESIDVDEKKKIYLLSNRFNWDVILFDIENNIIPKISDNKENTINTFKLLISLYDKEKQELNRRNDLLDDIYEQIESYEELVRFGEKYNTNQYFYVIREQIYEDDDRFPKGVSRKQIEMSYFLNNVVKKEIEKLKVIRERVESNIQNHNLISETIDKELDSLKIIDDVDIDILSDEFDKVYKNATILVNSFKEYIKEEYTKQGIEIPNEISGKPKNIVLCLFDISKENIEKYKDRFIRAREQLLQLSTVRDSALSKKKSKIKILYEDVEKEKKFDIPYVSVFRIRTSTDTRVGFVKFTPSKKIMSELQKRYGLDENLEIFGIVDAITKVEKKEDYKPLVEMIQRRENDLIKIGEMLYSENSNIEDIISLIDNGIDKMNLITNEEVRQPE